MIKYIEVFLSELQKKLNTDNLVMYEEANVDEAVTAEAKSRNKMKMCLNEE